MDKVNNFLYYLILILMFAFLVYYLHSRFMAVVLAVMIVFPVFSYISMRSAAKKLELRISANTLWVSKNEETQLNFVFKNKGLFPILNCIVTFNAENRFFPNEHENIMTLSVPAGKEYKTTVPLTPVCSGLVNISVERIEVRDILNIFSFTNIKCPSCFFYVLPRTDCKTVLPKRGELYSEDSLNSVKNANGTQIDGVRDYEMGDKLRNIHWKLSAKKQDLLVKEFSDNNEESAILLAELYSPAIDDILDNLYSTALMLTENAYTFTLAFAGAGSEQLTKMYVTDENMLRNCLEKIYLSYPSQDDEVSLRALRREYAGSGIIYIHGNGEKAVTDII